MGGPVRRDVISLANQLMLGHGDPNKPCGGAVFLVGAGCSASAGIPLGAEVAQRCAQHLAGRYSNGELTEASPEEALKWLVDNGQVPESMAHLDEKHSQFDDRWGPKLYTYFFDEHLSSINQQREIINKLIDDAGDQLNWAHICLGELVRLGYVHTVLTTNFDQLVLQGIVRTGIYPVLADGLEALDRVTAQPKRPQVVHLHGSMHTYNPRNSRAALAATREDPTLRSVLYNVLQLCDVFVVVGYAGGEEGIMDLLHEAASRMRQLVIYWVLYESDESRISERARKLLEIGDNKFVLVGYDADKLFREIMEGLKIGAPEWINDPIGALVQQSEKIVVSDEHSDIKVVVEAFSQRVRYADAHRLPELDVLEESAALRLRGDYEEVLRKLGRPTGNAERDPEWLRLRGASAFTLARERDDPETLEAAVADFLHLVDLTDGERRYLGYVQLFETLLLWNELTGEPRHLEKLVECAQKATSQVSQSDETHQWGTIQLYRGQALQSLGEAFSDSGRLMEAELSYEAVLEAFADSPTDRRWTEAKIGLATTLQQIGEVTGKVEYVQRAVTQQRELAPAAVAGNDPLDYAGRLANFAGALIALAQLDPDHKDDALREAEPCLRAAIQIYESKNDAPNLMAARKNLDFITSQATDDAASVES